MTKLFLPFAMLVTLGVPGLLHAAATPQTSGTAAIASQQIDALLAADWQKKHLQPNAPAGDETFVRRLYLDVVGRIPTYRETEEFLHSTSGNKRAGLIDKLLASDGYAQHFFNYWADILRAQTRPLNGGGISGMAYTRFIKDSLRDNTPYDQFVRELVAAQGKAWESGQIGYYMRDRNMPLDNMATTVRIFLGTRIECAQCHNHPFDKWTQMQFYQMAAFTYGVESNDYNGGQTQGVRDLMAAEEKAMREQLKIAKAGNAGDKGKGDMEAFTLTRYHIGQALQRARDPLRYAAVSYRDKKLQLPHDYHYDDAQPNSVVQPATLMGRPVAAKPGTEGLDAFAAWISARDNPRFTTVIVNRLWKKVFGRGLIEPVDELMDATVAINPELMKYLENYMRAVNYDMKAYLRALYNTQAYQRSVSREEFPAGIEPHFTGPLLRRMSAEQMWDSFVALINPTPDMPNLSAHETDEKRLAGARKMHDALESLTPLEMLKGAEAAAGKYREQALRLKEIQKEIAAARANNAGDKVRDLNKQSGELQRNALKSVNDHIFVPAVLKLAAHGSASPKPGAEAGSGTPMLLGGDVELNMGSIPIAGYDPPRKTDEQRTAQQEAQQRVMLDEAAYFGIPEKERKSYLSYRLQQQRDWLRSAEIESPAPRGHYLREFGQSDREFVENSNSDASIPQALALMNSALLPQVMAKYSQLMLTVNKAPSPDDQVAAAYLTLLSRTPTPAEKEAWLKWHDKGLGTMEDLIYALINTQQFIFIQ